MNQMLQQRISALMGSDMPMQFQEGGEVDLPSEMMMANPSEMMAPTSNEDLEQAIGALMRERDMADDPVEKEVLEGMTENLTVASQAPMAEQAMMLAEQGRGGDTRLAHLRVGEVVLPPEAFDDAQFEAAVGRKFEELDLDPEAYVVGAGIASLNPITGLEEFGWFKKTFKSIKKVVKKVAPLAVFIPGIGTALGAALGGIGGLAGSAISAIPGLGGVASTIGGVASTALKGLGSLGIPGLSPAAQGAIQAGKSGVLGTIGGALKNPLAGGLLGGQGSTYGGISGQEGSSDFFRRTLDKLAETSPQAKEAVEKARASGATDDEIAAEVEKTNPGLLQRFGSLLTGGPGIGGLGTLGTLGAVGAAGALGKLAFDEAKNRRGVPLTPLTQEGSTGRYNIEAEIARRMGKEAPNPVEFGLLPTGTIPTLSGGRRAPAPETEGASDTQLKVQMQIPRSGNRGINPPVGRRPDGSIITLADTSDPVDYELAYGEPPPKRPATTSGAVMSARYGGPVMAFAEGGNVDMADFKRMDGKINGPGTEISDDIPAMLSDGEFVMTGRAVRGAGAFDMAKGDQGIITLTPNGSESRDKGTNLMYEMMDLFAEYADKPKGAAA